MNISAKELSFEKKYLETVKKEIRSQISELGQELFDDKEKIADFKKFVWDNKTSMDKTELKMMQSDSDLEVYLMMQKGKYFDKLYKIQNNPYFGSIIFDEELGPTEEIYIGVTHLANKEEYLIHDWRSPICSLFYDFEVGKCNYIAPEGIIYGELKRKRQYKIKDGNLVHIFDNSISIDDDLLQEVLANESSEKMKNIVNTIQEEQNKIIRNIEDKHLIVQGIAGSGKTSVALHRIAFLLYRLENLNSSNVLIFSPNNVFTEYISNVLPELGEDNTMQTTFHDFLNSNINEYKQVTSFSKFIAKYYKYDEVNPSLIKYKQSDEIINDIDNYIKEINNKTKFIKPVSNKFDYHYEKEELNEMFHDRYNKFPIFTRIKEMAIKLSEQNYEGKHSHVKTFQKSLLESLNIKKDYKKIFSDFFYSPYSKINLTENEIKSFVNKKELAYEDALLFVYIKGLLEGFDYNNRIKEVVIDEAQDYNKMQYIILSKIFKTSGFTILGDINQTINPYYKYQSLDIIRNIFKGSSKYLELTKTYRSTSEIIDFTNKILNLNHVSAIRRENQKPVVIRKKKDYLKEDITRLKNNYKSIAIITKDDLESENLYNSLKKDFDISLVNHETTSFKRDFIVIPSYLAKGLEFDAVIVYNEKGNNYKNNEKYLFYVACTRAQHELIIYWNEE